MNLSQLYDNIVLRDLLEYATPGFVFLLGIGLVSETFCRVFNLDISVIRLINHSGSIGLFVSLMLSYAAGHVLTAISKILPLRKQEPKLVLDALSTNAVTTESLVAVIARHLDVTKEEVKEWLSDLDNANLVRELGRGIISTQMPELYREYVGRHSIFSRFSQNMAIALTWLFISAGFSLWLLWPTGATLSGSGGVKTFLTFSYLSFIIVVAIIALLNRAADLRKTMAKHTFQIWYLLGLKSGVAINNSKAARVESKDEKVLQTRSSKKD